MNKDSLFTLGDLLRRKLVGKSRYDETSTGVYGTPVMKKFIEVTTATIFGALWARPGLDLKARALVCVVSDIATGRERELPIHLQIALREGWSQEELTEVMLQMLGYVGAPLVRGAMLAAEATFEKINAASPAAEKA